VYDRILQIQFYTEKGSDQIKMSQKVDGFSVLEIVGLLEKAKMEVLNKSKED
jgi:hypothetical protein